MKPLSLNEPAAIWPEAPVWTYPGVDVGLPFAGTLQDCLEALLDATPRELSLVFIELTDCVIESGEIAVLLQKFAASQEEQQPRRAA